MNEIPVVRLGLIGCGLIAKAHGHAALQTGSGVEFTACASRRLASAEAWAADFGVQRSHVYDDAERMLRREQLDGVVICTWPADHRNHIDMCLSHGVRHILCEKALVTRAVDALDIWRHSRQLDAVVLEGFMYRYHDAIRHVKERVTAGHLGAIDSIHATFHMLDSPEARSGRPTWRCDADAGGGVPHDFLCYPVDAAGWLSGGLPQRVTAIGARGAGGGTIDRLYGTIEYDNGCVASVSSSRHGAFDQCLEVIGSRAQIRLPTAWSIVGDALVSESRSTRFLLREETSTRFVSETQTERLVELPVYGRQLRHFADVIHGHASPAVSLRESVMNAYVLDALVAAMDGARMMPVNIPADIGLATSIAPQPSL